MKKSAFILFGLLNSLSVIILTTILVAITGEYFFIFNILYFIPIGTILLGILSNIGVKIGMVYGDIPYSKKLIIPIILISLISFIGMYFLIYKITYISPNMEINYRFYGEHISNFMLINTSENITFSKFISFEIASRNYNSYISFGNVAVPIGIFRNGPIDLYSANWFLFICEGLGFIAGGIYVLDELVRERYCKDCKKYYRTKKLFSTNMQTFEEKLEKFDNCIKNGESLNEFISSLDKLPLIKRKSYVIATIVYCPSCAEGIMYIKYKVRAGLYFENKHSKMRKYELDSNVIEQVIK